MKHLVILKSILLIIPFCLILFLFQCKKDKLEPIDPNNPFKPTPYSITIPKFFPTKIYIPDDNPMTFEGIELGRYLFYDGRLSGRTHPDSLMSCATCHKQEFSFECGLPRPAPQGITGISTPHVMLPMINLVWNPNSLLWNGKVNKIEDLVWMGVIAPHEMYGDTNRVKSLLQTISIYPPMFKKAFGSDVITMKNISKAIAQFIRTLISSNSKFDRYLRGETQLTSSELSGFVLFTTEEGADCFHCHGSSGNPLFTTNLFYNNALDTIFNDPRDRFAVTGNAMDKGAYRAPTLRNIELTGPYMRDGRFTTLQQVVDFYSEGLQSSPYVNPLMHKIIDGGAQLTNNEKNDLISFLKTLTDTSFINNPAFKKPVELGN